MTTPLQTAPPPASVRHSDQRCQHTYTLQHAAGPVVVDVWEPAAPSDLTPILLLHGWGGSGSYWRETARDLSQTTRVIVPDLPGTGRSQPVKRTQDMFDQVDVLAWLLDELDLDQIQLVGHSMGGAMSVLFAGSQPERVERLVLTSLTFFMTKAQENIYHGVMQAFRTTIRFRPNWLVHVPGVARMMATHYFHRVPQDKAVLRQGLSDYLELDAKTALACAANATDPAIREAGERVTAPTLLIAARQDQMMPLENVDFTAEIIGDCEVRWIEECGHLPMVEKPRDYIAILRDFLDV